MKMLHALLALALATSTAFFNSAQAAQSSRGIPTETDSLRWDESTIIGALVRPTQDTSVKIEIPGTNPGELLNVKLWKAKVDVDQGSRGLYLILPGTGGNAESTEANLLALSTTQQGYDCLVLTDPFSADFQRSFSHDRLIGFPRHDAADYAKMLKSAITYYRANFGEPTTLNLMGISLGGTYSALTPQLVPDIKFDRYIAVNPPIDFQYAIDRIDDLIHIQTDVTDFSLLLNILAHIVPIATNISGPEGVLSTHSLYVLKNDLPHNEKDNKALIGFSFQRSLIEITRGLFAAPAFASPTRQAQINNEIGTIGFDSYLGFVGIAFERGELHPVPFSTDIRAMDLRCALSAADKSKVFVITSRDDFLITPRLLHEVSDIIGDHLYVMKSGGHAGAIWTPGFKSILADILNRN